MKTPALYLRILFSLGLLCSLQFVWAVGDTIRQETHLDQVYQQYNLTGKDVIVAIFDRGIDYTHPDFIDANGNSRIAYIFDMVDNTGQNDPDNPYGVGTIYDAMEINQALSSGTPLATMDRYGHGIATTGIAAGNGRAGANGLYRGVAYEATIIAVKGFQDNFPAAGTVAAQAGFFDPSYIGIGLQFISDKVAELGLPSVTLMNLGSIGGSTDGTSEICQQMDAFVGPGKLLVCGVGDDGGNDNRASGTLAQGTTAELEFNKATAGNLRLELWYPGEDRFDITLELPNGTEYGPYASPATNAQVDAQTPPQIFYYHRGANFDFSNASSNTRQVLIDFQGPTGVYKIKMNGATVTNGNWTASLNPARLANGNEFRTFVQAGGSINDYASAFEVITPTDYVADNTWIDIDGTPRSITGQGNRGELWLGSSSGPTVDGRRGVDIAAPGEVLFTSYSSNTYYAQFRFNLVQGGNGFYGLQNAVSAASPLVTGFLALMLEMKADLTNAEVKTLFSQSARSDAFTGTTPNVDWGYGKLDALATIQALESTLSIDKLWEEAGLRVFPQPAQAQLNIRWERTQPLPYTLRLFDLQGRLLTETLVRQEETQIETSSLARGMYLIRLEDELHVVTQQIVIQ